MYIVRYLGDRCYTSKMSKVLSRILQSARNIFLRLCSMTGNIRDAVALDVPYVSQFATSEWSEKILKDGAAKNSDPAWQEQGAISADEYASWVTTTCGMACTEMVRRYYAQPPCGIINLAKDALEN